MSHHHNNPEPLEINIKVKAPSSNNEVSPTFGTSLPKNQLNEAMEKVGKHGKSHHLYMKVMSQHKPPAEMRKISLGELAEHTKPDSAWLSLNGIVYDVSVYLHYHPGGDIILKGCGKDATPLFCTPLPI
jgi:cytochrome b involved in lipid metabolism